MTQETSYRRVGVLDTNVLHYVGLYLRYAKENGLFPWHLGDAADDPDPEGTERARQHLEGLDPAHSAKESLQRGFHVVRIASARDLALEYGPISELELLVGRVRGKAVLNAAKEGIPDRMWSGLAEREIRNRVTDEAMKDTLVGVTEIGEWLGELGLADTTASRKELADAIGLACEIAGNVYLEVADSIVYASAILAGAEILFTTDGPLRDTVNRVQRPGDGGNTAEVERFQAIQESLRPHVVAEHSSGDPLFPRAHTVTPEGRLKPEFP